MSATTISKKQGNALTEDLREMFKSEDFKKLLEKHGFDSADVTGFTYGGPDLPMKITVKQLLSEQELSEEFDQWAKYYGLEGCYGKRIKVGRDTMGTIIEIRTKNPKYPVIVKADNGKSYKLPVETAKARIEEAERAK